VTADPAEAPRGSDRFAYPPKGPLGQAIQYTLGQWRELQRFLEDARVPLDNNWSERALRLPALGRKNYLFFGGDEPGENIAGLYSLVQSCELNGIDPRLYLADVLLRVKQHPHARIDELLPHLWKASLPNTS
jgi:transposase